MALWDLRTEAAPAGMLRLASDAMLQRLEEASQRIDALRRARVEVVA